MVSGTTTTCVLSVIRVQALSKHNKSSGPLLSIILTWERNLKLDLHVNNVSQKTKKLCKNLKEAEYQTLIKRV